jgi:ATP synthase, F1 delta subunit
MYEYLDRRYALALYKVAEEKGKVEEYLQNLREIVDLINSTDELLQVIKHPQISSSRKKETFTKIFKGKIDDELLSFLLILIDKGRILYLKEKLAEMEKIHLERENTILATVKTVIALTDEERINLKSKLENKYKKIVILQEEIEKDLLGGVYVRVGNDVIDGTVKSKLAEMRALMLRGE